MKTAITAIVLAGVALGVTTSATARTAPPSDLVVVNGQVVAQDPDANIRGQLRREPRAIGF